VCLVEVLEVLCNMDLLRPELVDKGIFPVLSGLMACPEPPVMALAAKCVSHLAGSRDAWKDAAREAGVLPAVARLVRNRNFLVCFEAARAVRALATNVANKRVLVEEGVLHGLRDMLDLPEAEARESASEALFRLANHEDNAYDLTRTGALRPLVGALSSRPGQDRQLKSRAADTLGRMAKIHVWDNRKEIAEFRGIPALAGALAEMKGDDEGQIHVAKALRYLSRHDQLDGHAVHTAQSSLTVDARVGVVGPDSVADANRREMAALGLASQLGEMAGASRHAMLVRHATAALDQLQNRDTASPAPRPKPKPKTG